MLTKASKSASSQLLAGRKVAISGGYSTVPNVLSVMVSVKTSEDALTDVLGTWGSTSGGTRSSPLLRDIRHARVLPGEMERMTSRAASSAPANGAAYWTKTEACVELPHVVYKKRTVQWQPLGEFEGRTYAAFRTFQYVFSTVLMSTINVQT